MKVVPGDRNRSIGRWLDAKDTMVANEQDEVLDLARRDFVTQTAEVLPLVLGVLTKILTDGKDRERIQAATLILRVQGLLVDKTTKPSVETVETLLELLRRPRRISSVVIDADAESK